MTAILDTLIDCKLPVNRMGKKIDTVPKQNKKVGRRPYGPGRPTSTDLAQRKTRIVDVATSLFLEKGFAETSLMDVARQAGVATRTIYQHYGNKEDIFRAVLEQLLIDTAHEQPVTDVDRPLVDALVATAHYILTNALSVESISFQRLMIAESNRFPELMREVFETLYSRFHTNIVATFQRLVAAKLIPAGDHIDTTKYFIHLLLGNAPLQMTMSWIQAGPSEEEIRDKVSLFIAGRFGLESENNLSGFAQNRI
jgi:TetR/AcrR family transcriptional repressor of mexJK operon